MIHINALGKACPIPVIEAKKALSREPDSHVIVFVDNLAAVQNLEKMAQLLGHSFEYEQHSTEHYEVSIGRKANKVNIAALAQTRPPKTPDSSSSTDDKNVLTVLIGSNQMGSGSDELGSVLVKGFIYSLCELSAPPKNIIFFNSGAFLTAQDSNAIDDLKKLEKKGTNILTCGTCVNYYKLDGSIAVGTVVNMYDITESIVKSCKIISI